MSVTGRQQGGRGRVVIMKESRARAERAGAQTHARAQRTYLAVFDSTTQENRESVAPDSRYMAPPFAALFPLKVLPRASTLAPLPIAKTAPP